jgi:hypothetical protein
MKSRERQQIGLKHSPLTAEKLVGFLMAIFPKAEGLSCATLKKCAQRPESPNTSTIRTQRDCVPLRRFNPYIVSHRLLDILVAKACRAPACRAPWALRVRCCQSCTAIKKEAPASSGGPTQVFGVIKPARATWRLLLELPPCRRAGDNRLLASIRPSHGIDDDIQRHVLR